MAARKTEQMARSKISRLRLERYRLRIIRLIHNCVKYDNFNPWVSMGTGINGNWTRARNLMWVLYQAVAGVEAERRQDELFCWRLAVSPFSFFLFPTAERKIDKSRKFLLVHLQRKYYHMYRNNVVFTETMLSHLQGQCYHIYTLNVIIFTQSIISYLHNQSCHI